MNNEIIHSYLIVSQLYDDILYIKFGVNDHSPNNIILPPFLNIKCIVFYKNQNIRCMMGGV
jgi:hypothetical protein